MDAKPLRLQLPDSDISYSAQFFSRETADRYFSRLQEEINWRQDDVKVFGRVYAQPRLTALYADNGQTYSYSQLTLKSAPFGPVLAEIKNSVEQATKLRFNSCLCNLYRDGQDSNGWHSDDEKELGSNPPIASVSFGADRIFHLRYKKDKSVRHRILLEHGSLLLMQGSTQHHWHHQLPKTAKTTGERINLTFRYLH